MSDRLTCLACALALALAGCDERQATPPGSTPAPAPSPVSPASGHQAIDVNGNPMVPRTVLAARRGGETVYVAISSVAARTCDEMFSPHGTSLAPDEILLDVDLIPGSAGSAGGAGATWTVGSAHWPGGAAGPPKSSTPPPETVVTGDLPRSGGLLRLRYQGEFQVGTASPRAWLAVDTTFEIKPCGDVAGMLPPPQPVEARLDGRTIPIRSAHVTWRKGVWQLELATLPRTCGRTDVDGRPGDLAILIRDPETQPFVHLYGDLLPTQTSATLRPAADVRVRPAGPLEGDAPVRIDLDVETDKLPIVLHGHVEAVVCPRP